MDRRFAIPGVGAERALSPRAARRRKSARPPARRPRVASPGSQERQGFSLIELLVALVIMGALAGGVTLAFRTALDANDRLGKQGDAVQEARIVLGVLRADIQHAALTPGSERSWFIGSDESDGENDADTLRLIARSRRIPLRDLQEEGDWESQPRHADWSAVTYFVAPGDGGDQAGLFRRELVPPGVDPFEEFGEEELLSPAVMGINFRYFDGIDWLDSWDTVSQDEQTLPRAVEVIVTFRPDPFSDQVRQVAAAFVVRAPPPSPVEDGESAAMNGQAGE